MSNIQESEISFPCQWDRGVLEKIIELNKERDKNIKIGEIYGVPISGPICDGRTPSSVNRISEKEAIELNEFLKENGIRFNYLLNAPFDFNNTNLDELKAHLRWVQNSFMADSVTVTSTPLMEFIAEEFPSLRIKVSTIAGVKTSEDVDKFAQLNPYKIVVHHDANRDFAELEKITKKATQLGINIEVMTTESCLRGCPNRTNHYQTLSTGEPDIQFHRFCNSQKLQYPAEFLKANMIRPEDIQFYEALGLKHFKVTGRSKPSEWMFPVIQAHLERRKKGNLVDLMGLDPRLNGEQIVYIDNESLDGFIQDFPQNNPEEEIQYCNEWAIDLWKKGKLKIQDSKLQVIDGRLTNTQIPNRLTEVYKK